MAKVIEFHVPANYQKAKGEKTENTAAGKPGQVIEFASLPRKSA